MRPDLQQDPRPEFGMPAPRTGGYPVAPYGGPPSGPHSAPQPVPHPSGGFPAGPYSGPQRVAARPTTGPQAYVRDAAAPTVRRRLADDVEPGPRNEHPSGPLPAPSHRRGGGRRRTGRTMLLALVAAGAVAAGAAGYVAIAQWGTSSDQAVAPTAGAGPAAATSLTGANLATRQTPLGTVATSDGYTLYQYTKDSNKPAAATCTGTCAEQWPPVLASDGDPWLKGIDASRVGTVDRPDGTKQLTLNGWPLYRYGQDTGPGETAGNGVGGSWKAVGPDGKPVAGDAAAAPAGGQESGGY
ncbi:hypothetical protein WCD74_22790 [Actinomycetospora sp. OC33-EN08]|uniref:Lipoprotein with Yx(FWY)xxD motif n=1 Tax=Actinomycetospora aurantiaca TaxID=3129233 RepID=A0ABU8MTM9_9PSEU